MSRKAGQEQRERAEVDEEARRRRGDGEEEAGARGSGREVREGGWESCPRRKAARDRGAVELVAL